MEPLTDKLQKHIDTARIHIDRLNKAYESSANLFPVSPPKFKKITDVQRAFMDQYIFRFSKLQDVIGQKLFKDILETLGEETNALPFIDIFNRLEKFGIVDNYQRWMKLREIRNDVSHEYPLDIQETINALNTLYQVKDELLSYYSSIESYLLNKNLVK